MGVVLDTTVFIDFEKLILKNKSSSNFEELASNLSRYIELSESVGIASITVSELLLGVHRSVSKYKLKREAFVEAIIRIMPVIPFDLGASRIYSRIWMDLIKNGQDIGTHDRMIASTALNLGWSVGTANLKHFSRIKNLDVIEIVFPS